MPGVENVVLRPPAPSEDRKAAAMEKTADQHAAIAAAQQKAADAMAAYTGMEMRPYRRAEFFWQALMASVSGGAVSTDLALNGARELCDGFENEFPDYVNAQQ